jgi:hypothetical protein
MSSYGYLNQNYITTSGGVSVSSSQTRFPVSTAIPMSDKTSKDFEVILM